jgi:hypothetical protein
LGIALEKENPTNIKDLICNTSNTLNNHPLLSILQVLEIEMANCEGFEEYIAMMQMEVDRVALKSSSKVPIAPLLSCEVVELDVSNS